MQPWVAADSGGAPSDWRIGLGMFIVGCLVFEINRRAFRDDPDQKVWSNWIPWTFGPLVMALLGLVTLIGSFTN